MESWVLQVISAAATLIAGYTWMKFSVAAHEKKLEAIDKETKEYKKELDKKLDAGVKRFEELQHQISQLLDKELADKKYASKELLDLHIKTIEKDIREVKESNAEMGKKLDHLIGVLSTNIVRTITPHGAVYGGNNG